MGEPNSELFNQSLDRCLAEPGFMDRFYEIFLASSDEIIVKFADTDFQKQKRMLRLSLFLIVSIGRSMPEAESHFERIAEQHSSRQMDIKPELYDAWLQSLLLTVKELDPNFTPDTEDAWRKTLAYGIEFMRMRY